MYTSAMEDFPVVGGAGYVEVVQETSKSLRFRTRHVVHSNEVVALDAKTAGETHHELLADVLDLMHEVKRLISKPRSAELSSHFPCMPPPNCIRYDSF